MMACGGAPWASTRSASASMLEGEDRSNPSSPGVRSGTSRCTPAAAKRAARVRALYETGPEPKPCM